jgi:hypothetical protein
MKTDDLNDARRSQLMDGLINFRFVFLYLVVAKLSL